MVTQQLLDYITQQLQLGKSQEEIRNGLLASGWSPPDIDLAFTSIAFPAGPTPAMVSSVPLVTTLPGPLQLLAEAWEIYKQRFKTFVGIVLIPLLLIIPFSVILGAGSAFFLLALKSIGGLGGLILLLPLVLLIGVGSGIFQLWVQSALLYAIKDSQENIGIRESYRRGWHKIVSYWWVATLFAFVVLGGYLLFIVPGIIFSVWFSLAVFVLFTEDLRGMNTLLKSREYVRGRWWAVLRRLAFLGFFSIVIYSIPTVIGEILKFLDVSFIGSIIRFSVSVTVLLLVPLIMTYSFLIYKHLRLIKGEFSFVPSSKSKLGFTLVGILGFAIIPLTLLAIIFLGQVGLKGQSAKARDATRITDQAAVQTALEIYLLNKSAYPATLNELAPHYLEKVPVDPKTKLPYTYLLLLDGKNYQFCIYFETKPTDCRNAQSASDFGKPTYQPLPSPIID